jgi:hypothetical protein
MAKTFKQFMNENYQINENSEWETRHDEFVKAGKEATPEHIKNTLSDLKHVEHKTSKKVGFINQIVGKHNNGELARASLHAKTLHSAISKNAKSEHGTDARKELGQHLTYAKSLISKHKD